MQKKGYQLKVSTTHEPNQAKYSFLRDYFLQPYQLAFKPQVNKNFKGDFFNCDLLIINIPPKIKDYFTAERYLAIIHNILALIKTNKVKAILFLSTTGVYENNNGLVREDDTKGLALESLFKKNLILLQAEALFRDYSQKEGVKLTILRLAGLIGGGAESIIQTMPKSKKCSGDFAFLSQRHPKNFWKNLKTAPAEIPVNWVQQKDCLAVIQKIIAKKCWGDTYNVCSDHHPTKRLLYQLLFPNQLLQSKSSQPPKNNAIGNYKVVSNYKIKKKLNYSFQYSSPLQMIEI